MSWVHRYRLLPALAVLALGLSLPGARAQELPTDPAKAARALDDLARQQAPFQETAPNMRDQPDLSAGQLRTRDASELARLGLSQADPDRIPRLSDPHANAPPGEIDPKGFGATILATVAFVLAFFVLSRVLR